MQLPALTRFISILITAMVLLSGCANFPKLSNAGVEMTQIPVTEAPSGEVYSGKFIWHDLVTPDPVLAGQFYEKLFGWQIDYQGEYAVVRNGGKLIAGIFKVAPAEGETRDGVWVPTVSVPDVDKAADLVKANGGTILKGPLDMDKRGRAVFVSDSQRADLMLLTAKGGDPEDTKAEIGDWLWDEIWTNDPEAIQAFYKSVVGYDELFSGDGYDVLMHNGKWRAGIRQVRKGNKHLVWVPVIRVADPEATTERVTELGGKVWIAPKDAPRKGETALIADTTGALLLIQRWPPEAPKEKE